MKVGKLAILFTAVLLLFSCKIFCIAGGITASTSGQKENSWPIDELSSASGEERKSPEASDQIVAKSESLSDKTSSEKIDHENSTLAKDAIEKDIKGSTKKDNSSTSYVADHLRFGTRVIFRTLTDGDSGRRGGTYGSGTYLGTIYGLEAEQNVAPMYIYMSYLFNEFIGFEINYDRIEAQTEAVNTYTMIDKTDGNVLLSGPTMNLFFRYTNTTNITPFIGVGIGFYSGSFDPDPEWEYSSEYDGNAYNHMDVDNVLGLLFTTGAEWRVSKHWAIEFSAQYIKADVDATYNGYYYNVNYTTQEGHFPLSNIALRTGISYVF